MALLAEELFGGRDSVSYGCEVSLGQLVGGLELADVQGRSMECGEESCEVAEEEAIDGLAHFVVLRG